MRTGPLVDVLDGMNGRSRATAISGPETTGVTRRHQGHYGRKYSRALSGNANTEAHPQIIRSDAIGIPMMPLQNIRLAQASPNRCLTGACPAGPFGPAGSVTRQCGSGPMNMPKILLTVAAFAAVSLLGAEPAAAYDYPFCMKGEGGSGDCRYETMEQCQAALAGTPGFCQPNYWLLQRQQTVPPSRAHR